MTAVLIDTNAYAAFKQGVPDALTIIQRASQLVMSSVVLGELLAGFAVGTRDARNRAELQQFLASPRSIIAVIDAPTAHVYADVYRRLRAKGHPIPTNDLWIAATALERGIALFSYDAHFSQVEGLVVGSTPTELGLP
jgi:predicted nucleic acid-binding protein